MVFKIGSHKKKSLVVQPRKHRKRLNILLLPLAASFLWIGYWQIASFLAEPEAVFVLGGHENRERFAAKLAQQHPQLPVWISSGSPQAYLEKIFVKAGIKRDRLYLDYRARDTVTNFTTVVDRLKSRGIDSVYLITSENHMLRALIIGEIVFGSRGIKIKPIAVPADSPPESIGKCLRDTFRAILWVTTGHTGRTLMRYRTLELKPQLHSEDGSDSSQVPQIFFLASR
jgi:uncharacterized SAM-binding protein YcdF (DUF218 family)